MRARHTILNMTVEMLDSFNTVYNNLINFPNFPIPQALDNTSENTMNSQDLKNKKFITSIQPRSSRVFRRVQPSETVHLIIHPPIAQRSQAQLLLLFRPPAHESFSTHPSPF